MEEKMSGIVISGVNYGESDKILNIFTLEKGMVSAKIKGVKKAGAKLKFASEPFCFSEYVFFTSKDKRNVISASLLDSFYPLRENVEKFFCAGTFTEFVRKFMHEEMVSKQLFLLLCNGLKQLAYQDKPPVQTCAEFLYHALKLVGYGLNVDSRCECGEEIKGRVFFDCYGGSFHCLECSTEEDREVSVITLGGLIKLERGEEITDDEGLKIIRLIDFYLKYKGEVSLNSLAEIIKLKIANPS